jgi:hypothetical protein
MEPFLPPEDYVYFESHPAFVAREAVALHAKNKRFLAIDGGNNVAGIGWHYGPLRFARFTSDAEPNPKVTASTSLLWQRITRTDVPKGWRRAYFASANTRTGVSLVHPEQTPKEYRSIWNENMRRQAKKWDHSGAIIREIDYATYCARSQQSTLPKHLISVFDFQLKEKIIGHGDHVRIIGAYSAREEFLGAFASVDIPECQASLHLSSYLLPAGQQEYAGVGLMDAWWKHAQKHNVRYLEFGLFWRKHEPRSWRGFSRFKAQFGTKIYDYPPLLKRRIP